MSIEGWAKLAGGRTRFGIRRAALAIALSISAVGVQAGDITVSSAKSNVINRMYAIDANIDFAFSTDALEALRSGVALFVDIDVRIKRRRRLIWDPKILNLSRRYSIERHALTDRYVITDLVADERRIYDSLEAALNDLGQIREVPVVEASHIDGSDEHHIEMRVRLDLESLPAPLRPIAYISPSWRMSSGWYQWTLNP